MNLSIFLQKFAKKLKKQRCIYCHISLKHITKKNMLNLTTGEKKDKKYASSSMWSKYSMLKATIRVHKNIDVSKYCKLTAFLKSVSKGYKVRKSKVLEREQVEEFLTSAPDDQYLMIKVALTLGVAGVN